MAMFLPQSPVPLVGFAISPYEFSVAASSALFILPLVQPIPILLKSTRFQIVAELPLEELFLCKQDSLPFFFTVGNCAHKDAAFLCYDLNGGVPDEFLEVEVAVQGSVGKYEIVEVLLYLWNIEQWFF